MAGLTSILNWKKKKKRNPGAMIGFFFTMIAGFVYVSTNDHFKARNKCNFDISWYLLGFLCEIWRKNILQRKVYDR